jgi:undecaprenyl diphosphate synthase
MDGNGRWAKSRMLPAKEGHRVGAEALKKIVDASIDLGIEYLTVYAFSVDNWKRSKDEVDSLMNLMREFLKREKKDIADKDIRFIVIGRRDKLPEDILKQIDELTASTAKNNRLKFVIALNYGGRSEIVDGIKHIVQDVEAKKLSVNEIDEDIFNKYLYTHDIPDPDLFIRTSGEMRLSNFLLWQLSYTELWITPVYWPDFKKENLIQAIEEFNSRQRRFGGRQ